jgi:hypothetical protein
MQRIPHKDFRDAASAYQLAQILDIVASSPSFQRVEALRGNPQLVAEGKPNPLPAEIERQNSSRCFHSPIVMARSPFNAAHAK